MNEKKKEKEIGRTYEKETKMNSRAKEKNISVTKRKVGNCSHKTH